jgi:tricorn protease
MERTIVAKLNASLAPFLLRDPTLSRTHIAFTYGRNIWMANREGGDLRRLTSGGKEGKSALSPNGEHIAFIGEYGGPRGVFVMPVAGGEAIRLTYHPDDLGVVSLVVARPGDALGWTPDGTRILFSSRRRAFAGGPYQVVQLFTVPFEGGAAVPVPLVRAAEGSLSGDARRIAYVPHLQIQPEWKQYRGGETTYIQIADLSDSCVEATIPREDANDFNPMWVGDRVYFLSDRDGQVTLFAYDVKAQRVRKILENDGLDIKSASAFSDTIVFEQFGSLHLLDVTTGEHSLLDIRPVADFPEVRPHFENLAGIVGSNRTSPNVAPKLSPTGARAVLEIRGEILTVPAERGDIHNLTRTRDVVERDPAWSPDGNFIAYFSDELGEYALHIRDQSGLGTVRKIHLGEPPSFYYSPTWSPDSRKIAYTDKQLNYWYVDLDQGTPVHVDSGFRVDPSMVPRDPACHLPMAWSPDGRWLAYVKVLENYFHAAFVHSIEERRSYPLTDGMSDVLHVAFDKAGAYLYFTASTEVALAAEWLSMRNFGRSVRRSVYALLLDKSIPTPLDSGSDEENIQIPLAKTRKTRIEIDPDRVAERIVQLPVPARNYSRLFAGRPGVLFLVEAPLDQPFAGRPYQIHRFDLATQRTDRVLEDVTYFELSSSGDKMLYSKSQAKKRQWIIASTQNPSDGSVLRFESVGVHVEPRLEWKHLFEQVWRVQRDFLYDPGLHGLDLQETKAKYRPFLENIVSRNDLYYLFGEMLGNLSIGHLWAVPAEEVRRQRAKTGLLGADYGVERGRYRFERIYESDPYDATARSPLTEPGTRVEVGEYLLAIDGQDVRPSVEVFSYFERAAGKQVVLTVGPDPDGMHARQVRVVPLEDEYSLRYFAWIEANRRKVDNLSAGRVAYVHLPDCSSAGYRAFNRYFFAQVGKEAAIIDCRYNLGGSFPDYIIDCLKRPLSCYWHMREGQDIAAPMLSIFGPKVMLINERCTSMGDALPWMFRRAGIGPLIGKRTSGALVGYYAFPSDLLDGGVVTSPNLAFYNPNGEWEIENRGVSPDIEVNEDPRAAREGRDVQLERAVEVVMKLLSENPLPLRPQRPAYPRFHRKT